MSKDHYADQLIFLRMAFSTVDCKISLLKHKKNHDRDMFFCRHKIDNRSNYSTNINNNFYPYLAPDCCIFVLMFSFSAAGEVMKLFDIS